MILFYLGEQNIFIKKTIDFSLKHFEKAEVGVKQ